MAVLTDRMRLEVIERETERELERVITSLGISPELVRMTHIWTFFKCRNIEQTTVRLIVQTEQQLGFVLDIFSSPSGSSRTVVDYERALNEMWGYHDALSHWKNHVIACGGSSELRENLLALDRMRLTEQLAVGAPSSSSE